MPWFIFSTLGYFLVALQTILDKFLLTSRKVSHPAIYTFYSGLLSLTSLVLFPWGFHSVDFSRVILSLIAGIIFGYGVLALFFAIQKHAASRVIPVTGAVIPVVTYFLSIFLLEEKLDIISAMGVIILIFGGLLIAYEFRSEKGRKAIFGGFSMSVLSGFLLAVTYTIFKRLYSGDNFINVFIWTRLGFVAGAGSLLIISSWRKAILNSLLNIGRIKGEHVKSSSLFVLAKVLGGVGSILVQYAMALGSITVVNAMIALEYIFIFIIGISLSQLGVFQEEKDWRVIFQKILAMAVIAGGVYLVY